MPYTMQSYVDEMTMRLNRYSVSLELDPGTSEVIVNDARRFVHSITVQLFPERYGKILTLDQIPGNTATHVTEYDTDVISRLPNGTVTTNTLVVYTMSLPEDYVEVEAVVVTSTAGTWEARRITKKEMYSTLRNTSTKSTPRYPVYCVEKNTDNSTYHIYVSKGDEVVTPADVELWYSKALKYLQLTDPNTGLPDSDLVMSFEFEELVVIQSMLKALKKTNFNAPELRELLSTEFEQNVAAVEEKYNTSIDRGSLLLPSNEGLYPNVPVLRVPNNGLN